MSSVTVSARLTGPSLVSFVVSERDDLEQPVATQPASVDAFGVARATIGGLSSETRYYVGVDGDPDVVGSFVTPGADLGFSFVAASCANTGAEGRIFENIKGLADNGDVQFGIHMGDFHYQDSGSRTLAQYHADYDLVFASESQGALYRSMPWYYMRDDHEVSNDSDHTSAGTDTWITLYRSRVPHPPLADPSPTAPPYHSFVRGRVRFIVTDLRSDRSPKSTSDGPTKYMMRAAQLAWFKAELLASASEGQAVVWVNTFPWVAPTSGSADHWGGYNTQRQEIAGFIDTHELSDRIVIISGDAHMLAFDDGTNSAGGVPVCQCAPFFRTNSTKGGPYTHGPFTQSQSQYGRFDVTDVGTGPIEFRFRGVVVNQGTGDETFPIDETFYRDAD